MGYQGYAVPPLPPPPQAAPAEVHDPEPEPAPAPFPQRLISGTDYATARSRVNIACGTIQFLAFLAGAASLVSVVFDPVTGLVGAGAAIVPIVLASYARHIGLAILDIADSCAQRIDKSA